MCYAKIYIASIIRNVLSLTVFYCIITEAKMLTADSVIEPPEITREQLEEFHSKKYLDSLSVSEPWYLYYLSPLIFYFSIKGVLIFGVLRSCAL